MFHEIREVVTTLHETKMTLVSFSMWISYAAVVFQIVSKIWL